MDNKDEDFAAERAPGHNRRISRLDNVTKFQASLDSIKVNRTSSVSAKEDAVPIKEESEEDLAAEEVKKPEPEQAPQTTTSTSKPDAPQEKPKSETDEVGGDSSQVAKESVDSEKSAGAEQSSSAPDKSDAQEAL